MKYNILECQILYVFCYYVQSILDGKIYISQFILPVANLLVVNFICVIQSRILLKFFITQSKWSKVSPHSFIILWVLFIGVQDYMFSVKYPNNTYMCRYQHKKSNEQVMCLLVMYSLLTISVFYTSYSEEIKHKISLTMRMKNKVSMKKLTDRILWVLMSHQHWSLPFVNSHEVDV